MAKSARARSTCAAGALSERLRRVKAIRSSGVSGRRGSFWWRDMDTSGPEDRLATIPDLTASDPLGVWSRGELRQVDQSTLWKSVRQQRTRSQRLWRKIMWARAA